MKVSSVYIFSLAIWSQISYTLNQGSKYTSHLQGPPNTLFFGKCFKKTTEYFLKFKIFLFKVQSFRLIMENNFIQMTDSAGHAVASTIGPNFKHIIDCAAVFHQWLHEYCPLKRQLSLACRRNSYY